VTDDDTFCPFGRTRAIQGAIHFSPCWSVPVARVDSTYRSLPRLSGLSNAARDMNRLAVAAFPVHRDRFGPEHRWPTSRTTAGSVQPTLSRMRLVLPMAPASADRTGRAM